MSDAPNRTSSQSTLSGGEPKAPPPRQTPSGTEEQHIWIQKVLRYKVPRTPATTAAKPAPRRMVSPTPARPPRLQQAIHDRLMSFDELAGKIGSRPKQDKLGGIWKMSTRYKAVEREMGDVDARVTATGQTPLAGIDDAKRKQLEKDLNDALDELAAKATTYRNRHSKNDDKRDAANDLLADVNRFKRTLSAQLDAVMSDPALSKVKSHLTLEQAMGAKRLGINFADCRFDDFNDTKLDPANSKAGFGAGAMGTVAKLVHADRRPRIFKPEPLTDPGTAKAPSFMGVDPNAPHYGNRNIASCAVADVLGTKVMPETCYGMHNGQFGMVMEMAEGQSPGQKVTVKSFDPNKDTRFKNTLAAMNRQTDPARKAAYQKDLDQAGYVLNDKGQWEQRKKDLVKPWKTPPSPKAQASLHQQLNQLEWCDLVTGQMDRQPENYMIDIQGDQVKVTGIDNDLAFGKNSVKAEYSDQEGSTSVGKPNLIDKPTLSKLKATDFDRDLKPRLAGLLTDEEIDASRKRFALVRQHALDLETKGMVVDNWETWRTPDGKTASQFLAAQKAGSLFQRDLANMFKSDGLL